MKTSHDVRLEALNVAMEDISVQTFEDMDEQGARCAANMIFRYGDKICTTPKGFVEAMVQSHTLALGWLLANGYVTLTDKARASDEERAELKKAHDGGQIQRVDLPQKLRGDGAYL